ncbi:MAG TPA: hypothetical protein VFX97_08155 [Pyrinomonadaceae bacterium]|nr:hypothetical protein [Pyrinomonadaceae bacterium]
MKKKIVLLISLLCACSSIAVAQRSLAPEVVVRNLYAAQKSRKTDPFFQTKSRARLDKFFAKELADLIWNDAVSSARTNEVGQLGGDPLYNAQDMKITGFRIKRPMVGEGNLDLVEVPVTFKNFGKEQTILFRLERDKRRVWRITEIFYPGNEDYASSLTKILTTH